MAIGELWELFTFEYAPSFRNFALLAGPGFPDYAFFYVDKEICEKQIFASMRVLMCVI